MEETQGALKSQVLRKCHITWSDEHTDALVSDIMARADAELRGLLGIFDPEFDFTTGRENTLFVDWCYYAYMDSNDMFKQNYFDEIMQLRREWDIAFVSQDTEEVDNADSKTDESTDLS